MKLTVGYSHVCYCLVLILGLHQGQLHAQSTPPESPPAGWGPVSINLEDVAYPYPVSFLNRTLYGQDIRVAYMDVAPEGPAKDQTVVLLHGASYYGWYWEHSIDALSKAGYRTITVDRLGWGRSSKPIIPYSASLHASNVKAILDELGIEKAAIVGHSMGGRLASHFAHIYPDVATHLVMVNPIAIGAPSRGQAFNQPDAGNTNPDLEAFYASTLGLELRRVVQWKPEFLEHVRIRYGNLLSGEYPRLNLVRALNNGILSGPIDAFWPQLSLPALMLSGAQDGPNFPSAARRAVDLLPDGELYLIENAAHNPHLETPEEFNRELLRFLNEVDS